MSKNPFAQIREAQEQIVALAMLRAHQLITSAVEDVVAIRLLNSDPGNLEWRYRTQGQPEDSWGDTLDLETADGDSVHDELLDVSGGMDGRWIDAISEYLLVPADPMALGYGPSMPIDKYAGEFQHADLDPAKMVAGYLKHEVAHRSDTDKVVLVYHDEQGDLHEQPLSDVVEVGTLIDPETGDNMPLVGWKQID